MWQQNVGTLKFMCKTTTTNAMTACSNDDLIHRSTLISMLKRKRPRRARRNFEFGQNDLIFDGRVRAMMVSKEGNLMRRDARARFHNPHIHSQLHNHNNGNHSFHLIHCKMPVYGTTRLGKKPSLRRPQQSTHCATTMCATWAPERTERDTERNKGKRMNKCKHGRRLVLLSIAT